MKCHVFKWDVHCGSCTPDDFDEFDSEWRGAICPFLIKYVGADAMNDLRLVPRVVAFDPDGSAEFILKIPVEHYNDEDFDKIEEAVNDAAADLSGWSFEQLEDEEI